MEIRTTKHFDRAISKRIKKNKTLRTKIRKQLTILTKNPNHPSLKMHKLQGKRAEEMQSGSKEIYE